MHTNVDPYPSHPGNARAQDRRKVWLDRRRAPHLSIADHLVSSNVRTCSTVLIDFAPAHRRLRLHLQTGPVASRPLAPSPRSPTRPLGSASRESRDESKRLHAAAHNKHKVRRRKQITASTRTTPSWACPPENAQTVAIRAPVFSSIVPYRDVAYTSRARPRREGRRDHPLVKSADGRNIWFASLQTTEKFHRRTKAPAYDEC